MDKVLNSISYILLRFKFKILALIVGNPQNSLNLIGVAGTSGKSTTATMVYHVLKEAGVKVGLVSNFGIYSLNRAVEEGSYTSIPDMHRLLQLFRLFKDDGVKWVIVETPAVDLDYGNFVGLKFDIALFTNLKKEQSTWKDDWESYKTANSLLIKNLKANRPVIYNKDDQESYRYISQLVKTSNTKINEVLYSKKEEISDIRSDLNSINFKYRGEIFDLNVIGDYNLENWLGAIKIAELFKINLNLISSFAKTFRPIEGVMKILVNQPFLVIVDYAKNPDALEKSLIAASNYKRRDGKLITVMGLPGGNVEIKKKRTGEILGRYSDITILTALDPFNESLYNINSKIIEGAESSGSILVKRFRTQQDYFSYKRNFSSLILPTTAIFSFDEQHPNSRFFALDFALFLADIGDVVVVESKVQGKDLIFNSPNGPAAFAFSDTDALTRILTQK